jgi:hypothetical protein
MAGVMVGLTCGIESRQDFGERMSAPIWRFRGGKFVEDHALFEELLPNDRAR